MQEIQITGMPVTTLTLNRIAYLICSYITRNLSHEDAKELQDWVSDNVGNQLLFAELILPYNIKSVLLHEFN